MTATVAVAVLGLSLTACGGSDEPADQPSAEATSDGGAESPSDGYPFDTSDTGDDRLSPERLSYEFDPDAVVSWQFPTFYDDGESDEISTFVKVGDVRSSLLVVAEAGTAPEDFADRLEASDEETYEIQLGGRDFVAVVSESPTQTKVAIFGALPDGPAAGVSFDTNAPLADIPPERIAELHQTALSIQPESSASE